MLGIWASSSPAPICTVTRSRADRRARATLVSLVHAERADWPCRLDVRLTRGRGSGRLACAIDVRLTHARASGRLPGMPPLRCHRGKARGFLPLEWRGGSPRPLRLSHSRPQAASRHTQTAEPIAGRLAAALVPPEGVVWKASANRRVAGSGAGAVEVPMDLEPLGVSPLFFDVHEQPSLHGNGPIPSLTWVMPKGRRSPRSAGRR